MKRFLKADALLFGFLLFCLGASGMLAKLSSGDAAAFFMPSGLLVLCLHRTGPQAAPVLWLVSLMLAFSELTFSELTFSELTFSELAMSGGLSGTLPKLATAGCLAGVVVMQALFVAQHLKRGMRTAVISSHLPKLFGFVALFAVSSVASSLGRLLALHHAGVTLGPSSVYAVALWSLGDFTFLLLACTYLLAFSQPRRPQASSTIAMAEVGAFASVLALISVIFLTQEPSSFLGHYGGLYPLILTPVHMWAALRFRLRGFSICLMQVLIVGLLCAHQGMSLFAGVTTGDALCLLYLYSLAIHITGLGLIGSLAKRDELEESALYEKKRYHNIFETSVLPIFEEDWSGVRAFLDQLRAAGVYDLDDYFAHHPDKLVACMRLVKLLDTNQAALQLLQAKDKAEALANLEVFIAPESMPVLVALLSALARGETRYRGEQQLLTTTGQRLYAIFDFNCVPGSEKDLGRVVYTFFDVTDSKVNILKKEAAEMQLRRAKDAAEAASKAKSLFLANMSHEIRTPITVIMGFSHMLQEPGIQEEERDHLCATIIRNGRHLLQLIDDILDLSKIEAQQLRVERIDVHTPLFLDELEFFVQSLAKNKKVNFELERPADLPSGIVTDPTRLRQIFINIIGNAIKFTPAGGRVKTTVQFSRQSRDAGDGFTMHALTTDTGCGIAEDRQSEIFRYFVQGDPSYTRRYGGTGLGLVLSRRLARELGGDVWLQDSQVGRGSTFGIRISGPLSSQSPAVIAAAESKEDASLRALSAHSLRGCRILVAEDQPDLQKLIDHELRRYGAQVDVAGDGLEGLAMARSGPYQAIILDIQMPLLDGYGTAARLREEGYKGPLIALTAHGLEAEARRSQAAGFDAHLTKPITTNQLVTAVLKYQNKDAVDPHAVRVPDAPAS